MPVIINPNSGTLAQAFVRSLSQALKYNKLQNVVPDNYFSEALHTIDQWKQFYKNTYEMFQQELGDQASSLLRDLRAYDYNALNKFREIYPKLTSGSTFNPVIDDDVLSVYRSVNRRICEKHGYDGIYIIFDEFSKYVEGHSEEGFSADMKTLQDICELCNSSKDEQLHLTWKDNIVNDKKLHIDQFKISTLLWVDTGSVESKFSQLFKKIENNQSMNEVKRLRAELTSLIKFYGLPESMEVHKQLADMRFNGVYI